MAKYKIYKIAKELNLASTTILEFLSNMGHEMSKGHMGAINEEHYQEVVKKFDRGLWTSMQDKEKEEEAAEKKMESEKERAGELEENLAEQLKALGVKSVEQAEDRLSAFESAGRAVKHADELFKSLAPAGLEQLVSDQSEAEGELEKAKTQLEATPKPSPKENVPALEEAEAAFARAGTALDKAESDERAHQSSLSALKQARDNAKTEWQRLADEEKSPERQQQLRQITTDLASIEKQQAEQAQTRKSLVGSGDRSERIRTYNYPQGRVTDHRINLTLYKLDDVMQGQLNQVVEPLINEYQAELLATLAND